MIVLFINRMKSIYFDLIEQSYYFTQDGFDFNEDYLTFMAPL